MSESSLLMSSVQNLALFAKGTSHHPQSPLGCRHASLSLSGQGVFERASLEDSLCRVWARHLHVPHRENPGAGAEGHPREHAGRALAAALR